MDCSNDSATLLANLLHIAHQGVRHFGIQSTGGLVQQEQGRIPGCQEWNQQHDGPGNATESATGKLCLDRGFKLTAALPPSSPSPSSPPKEQQNATSETKTSSPQQRQRHIGALPLTTRDATDEAGGTHHRVATFLQGQLLDDTWWSH